MVGTLDGDENVGSQHGPHRSRQLMTRVGPRKRPDVHNTEPKAPKLFLNDLYLDAGDAVQGRLDNERVDLFVTRKSNGVIGPSLDPFDRG